MRVAVRKEAHPGERRVAIVPGSIAALKKAGFDLIIESGAGSAAGFNDQSYIDKGARVTANQDEVLQSDIIVCVRTAGAEADASSSWRSRVRRDAVVIGTCDPLGGSPAINDFAEAGINLFALELIPRITRAQSMDVLSSQATIAGYRAVLLAATELPKMFPMLMTAAGTITAAKLLVIGAGVAGLQAIAIARKLGAVVSAYDVRTAAANRSRAWAQSSLTWDSTLPRLKIEAVMPKPKTSRSIRSSESYWPRLSRRTMWLYAQPQFLDVDHHCWLLPQPLPA